MTDTGDPERGKKSVYLLTLGATTDGEHHKQWVLCQLAKLVMEPCCYATWLAGNQIEDLGIEP